MNSSYNYADFIGLNIGSYNDRKASEKERLKKRRLNENKPKPEKNKSVYKPGKTSNLAISSCTNPA